MEPEQDPPSFAIRGNQDNINFIRSLSLKSSSSDNNFSSSTPPRLSNPTSLSPSFFNDFQPLPSPPSKHNNSSNTTTTAIYKCISSVLKKDGQILSIAVWNNMAYTGSETNVIRIWKLPEFTECGELKCKAKMVVAIQVSNDRVYAAFADCKIRVWSRRSWHGLTTHVRLATIPKAVGYVQSYLSGKDKLMKHMAPISSLAVNLPEDILYSASLDKTVKVWRISDLKCIETIQAHSAPINAIVVAEDGILYTASEDATVRVWRRNFCDRNRPHALTVTLPAKHSPVKSLTLTSDGGVLYGGCTDGYIHYWLRGWFSGQLQYGGQLQGHTHAVMCLTSIGNFLVSGSADSTGRVWVRHQGREHTCVAVLEGHRGPLRSLMAFPGRARDEGDQDECTVCTGSMDGVIKVWRVSCIGNPKSTLAGSVYSEFND